MGRSLCGRFGGVYFFVYPSNLIREALLALPGSTVCFSSMKERTIKTSYLFSASYFSTFTEMV